MCSFQSLVTISWQIVKTQNTRKGETHKSQLIRSEKQWRRFVKLSETSWVTKLRSLNASYARIVIDQRSVAPLLTQPIVRNSTDLVHLTKMAFSHRSLRTIKLLSRITNWFLTILSSKIVQMLLSHNEVNQSSSIWKHNVIRPKCQNREISVLSEANSLDHSSPNHPQARPKYVEWSTERPRKLFDQSPSRMQLDRARRWALWVVKCTLI